jgi:hypothetical protein
LFSGAVTAQAMHYFAVILMLPRLLISERLTQASLVAWPRWPSFYLAMGAIGALGLLGFTLSYADARSVYGVFSALHSWLELPLLLAALGGGLKAAG